MTNTHKRHAIAHPHERAMGCRLWGISRKFTICFLNSSPPSAAYMRQWIGSAMFQIMACRLFGAKSLSKPMLGYCQLDEFGPLWTNFSEILIKMQNFSFTKMHLKILSAKWRPFCPGGDELTKFSMTRVKPIHRRLFCIKKNKNNATCHGHDE